MSRATRKDGIIEDGACIPTALYVRTSMAKRDGRELSIPAQELELRRVCDATGRQVVKVYRDIGISANAKRPAFQRMMADMRKGLFTQIGVYSTSRLFRDAEESLKLAKESKRIGVTLFSATEPVMLDNATGRFIFRQMANLSEFEADLLSERIILGMSQRARNGGWCGPAPYGYRHNRDIKTLEVDPKQAGGVSMIFALALAGKGYHAIAVRLNQAGYTTQQGKPFTPVAVRNILRNEVYTGAIRFTVRENDAYLPKRQRPVREIITRQGTHEPLVDKKAWKRVQSILAKRAGRAPKVWNRPFVLAGILKCPECGKSMVMSRSVNRTPDGVEKPSHRYICGNAQRQGVRKGDDNTANLCQWNSINADAVEPVVIRRVGRMLYRENVIRDVMAHLEAGRQAPVGYPADYLSRLDRECQRQEKIKRRYIRDYEGERFNVERKLEGIARADEAIALCRKEADRYRAEVTGIGKAPVVTPEQVRDCLRDFEAFYTALPPDTQKTLLRLFLEKVTINAARDLESVKLHLKAEVSKAFR